MILTEGIMSESNWGSQKRIRKAILAILLPVASVLAYCVSVIVTFYIDTPKMVARATSPDRIRLKLEDMADDYQQILLRVEDPGFYSHHGVDLTTPCAGGTTITQGPCKSIFLQRIYAGHV